MYNYVRINIQEQIFTVNKKEFPFKIRTAIKHFILLKKKKKKCSNTPCEVWIW